MYGRPFCIASDGLSLVEDVGGTGGYESFILSVNEKPETDEQKKERKEILLWTKELGWTGREQKAEKML
ncbi:MAG: plasmid pRiA4b ORF-3 family protein [Ruminococcus sp.]|nr:plasmid pRiA4b ORF-3 family protein [Ruminococcus sp.]